MGDAIIKHNRRLIPIYNYAKERFGSKQQFGSKPPMPVPAPAVALEAPAVCWEVELSGRFQAYGSEQQFALETAHQRGDDVASISVRGTVYEVRLRGEQRQRGLGADAWRSRRVRRRVS